MKIWISKRRIMFVVLLILLTVIGIFTFRVIRHRRVHTNTIALVELVNELEPGETMTLDDIPFAWNSYFIYDPYTPVHVNPACMERHLLFQNFDISVTYLCFFYNDRLVARVSNRHQFPEVFWLVENGTFTRELEDVTPDH